MLRCLVGVLSLVATLACAQEAALPAGKTVVLTTAYGTRFDAYAAGPEDASRAVLLLHDRFGLNDQAREWADRFAGLGYRALAIDLYDGRQGKSWNHATSIMNSIDQVWADSDIAAALSYLRDKKPDRKTVVLGWDYGGTQALIATLHDPTAVAATVSYYPTRYRARLETVPSLVQNVAGPVMIVVAERDDELTTVQMRALRGGLSNTRVNFNVMGLDALSNLQDILAVLKTGTGISVMGLDADRGFSDPLSGHYDAAASATLWDITQDFLAHHANP